MRGGIASLSAQSGDGKSDGDNDVRELADILGVLSTDDDRDDEDSRRRRFHHQTVTSHARGAGAAPCAAAPGFSDPARRSGHPTVPSHACIGITPTHGAAPATNRTGKDSEKAFAFDQMCAMVAEHEAGKLDGNLDHQPVQAPEPERSAVSNFSEFDPAFDDPENIKDEKGLSMQDGDLSFISDDVIIDEITRMFQDE